ncbi:MAG: ornithine carbamoyltransferase [Tepidisphaeraceae bacterium]|jgi:ornithine carbamoyltransferase
MKNFISISQCSFEELRRTLDVAERLKKQYRATGHNDPILAGKTLAMIFEKPSLRTRVSFHVAMTHLGGEGILLRNEEVGLGVREPVADVARVLSGMCDGIMARTFEHQKILDLAKYSSVPVINGLTDYSHPCQAMTDILTIQEKLGSLAGKTIAFIGDGNNVALSLLEAAGRFNMRFILAAPKGFELPEAEVAALRAQMPNLDFHYTISPTDAVRSADAIYTDTWVSMGQEREKEARIKAFTGFIIDEKLLAAAPPHAIVMHCLPAYRGLEISDAVMEGPQSVIFDQAENRLHYQKGLLAVLMGNAQ